MSESGTNFPPQTYSSIFNLNIMAEKEGTIVSASSSTGKENSGPNSPQKHDCFTSSMTTIIILVLMYLTAQTTGQNCPTDTKVRTFSSLLEYEGNQVSFNKNDSNFMGNRVRFNTSFINKLEINNFVTYTEKYITWMDLSDKNISEVQDRTFYSLKCLKFLDLSYNKIVNLSRDVFIDLNNLQVLNLTQNNITYVTSDMFVLLRQVRWLDLSYNNISEMQPGCFDNNTKLEVLNLSHNGMKHLRTFFFKNLTKLRELYLHHNSFAMMFSVLFNQTNNLEVLDISDNNLVMMTVAKDTFNSQKLKYLNLSNNCLMAMLNDNIVEVFANTKTIIDINNNGFECKELMQYLQVFKVNNVTLAAGRNFSTKKHIHGIVCDALLSTDNTDHFLYLKVIVGSLFLIMSIFSILVAYDCIRNKGYKVNLPDRLRFWSRMRRQSILDYLQLDADT